MKPQVPREMVTAVNTVPSMAQADVESIMKLCILKILIPAVGGCLFWERRVSLDQRMDM